jgi:CrcB protein
MKTTLLIGLGSFIGGSGRYLISKLIQSNLTSVFPFGTFAVNIVGCFLIGSVLGYSSKNELDTEWQLFLTTGILGGFTTFSAFSMESINMLRDGHTSPALIYIALSICVGLIATLVGYSLLRM